MMETEKKPITEKILDHTLEIICLLTGEDCAVVKNDGSVPSAFCNPQKSTSQPRERNSRLLTREKVLDQVSKILQLLTGEMFIKELKYLEERKEPRKDAGMESYQVFSSVDGVALNGKTLVNVKQENSSLSVRQENQEQAALEVLTPELEGRIEVKVENCEDFPTGGNPSVEDNVAKCGAYNDQLKLRCSKEILLQEATCEKNDVTQDNIIRDCVGDPNKVILENNIKVVKLNYSEERLDIYNTHENSPIEESTSLSSENINHVPSEMEKHIPKDFIRDQTYRYPVRHEVSHNKKDLKKGDKNIKPTVTQQGGRPYVCRDCGKSYTQGSNLVIHQRKHTGERPFSCNECGKRFISRGNFATHKKIHTGEGTYICSDCGKSYVTRFHLVIHQRKHTGERPYTCNVCGKSFVSKSDLVRHEKVHQAYKPYNCSECGKRFTRSSDLVRHKKRHLESAVCK